MRYLLLAASLAAVGCTITPTGYQPIPQQTIVSPPQPPIVVENQRPQPPQVVVQQPAPPPPSVYVAPQPAYGY